jgi:hypothetical protein
MHRRLSPLHRRALCIFAQAASTYRELASREPSTKIASTIADSVAIAGRQAKAMILQ